MGPAAYQITIDGKDISSDLDPLLISLEIEMGDGGKADTLDLELDDSFGQIQLPRSGAPVSAFLYWSDSGEGVEFEGFTTQPKSHGGREDPHKAAVHQALHHVRHGHHHAAHAHHGEESGAEAATIHSSGSRSKGRILTLSAKSIDTTGKIKQPMQAHADTMSFGDVAQKWGIKAGLTSVIVDPSLASIQRSYWSIANESFMAWGTRIARELGATFKIFGASAVFVPRGGGFSATGKALTPIYATWGDNLLDWSITPVIDRPDFGSFGVRYYDPQAAAWMVETSASGSASKLTHTDRWKAAAKDHAKARGGANAAESKRDKGGGDSVTIIGEPAAQAEAPCMVGGIRAGADGTYLIGNVRHSLKRGAGFDTRLALKQPSGTAGVDDRQST